MSISDRDSARDAKDTFDRAAAALEGPASATTGSDKDVAASPLRETALHALNEASVDVDLVAQREAATIDSGLGALTTALSRARATYSRNPKNTVMVIAAVALGLLALTFISRRL